ncbi:MAG: hypothetical protein AAGA30_09585 [Planctomycetota bacterium]
MLVIQRINSKWTKSSRGGDMAAKRNATPLALILPPKVETTSGLILHDVRFFERENFKCDSQFFESITRSHVRLEPLLIRVSKHQVTTRFIWSWHHCGAPERDSHDLFHLESHQWGRFACNGRFGAESSSGRAWGYHKTVFNVGFINDFDRKVFVNTLPNFDDAQLALLK